MTRHRWLLIGVLAILVLSGCNVRSAGMTQSMGEIRYETAFATGREVLSQYFSVDPEGTDPATGVIKARPRPIDAGNSRLLGGSPARQIATLRISRDGKNIIAHVVVETQRQGSAIYRQMGSEEENYDSVPNKPPSELDAATTPEQNEVWRTQNYDHDMERKILEDLYAALKANQK